MKSIKRKRKLFSDHLSEFMTKNTMTHANIDRELQIIHSHLPPLTSHTHFTGISSDHNGNVENIQPSFANRKESMQNVGVCHYKCSKCFVAVETFFAKGNRYVSMQVHKDPSTQRYHAIVCSVESKGWDTSSKRDDDQFEDFQRIDFKYDSTIQDARNFTFRYVMDKLDAGYSCLQMSSIREERTEKEIALYKLKSELNNQPKINPVSMLCLMNDENINDCEVLDYEYDPKLQHSSDLDDCTLLSGELSDDLKQKMEFAVRDDIVPNVNSDFSSEQDENKLKHDANQSYQDGKGDSIPMKTMVRIPSETLSSQVFQFTDPIQVRKEKDGADLCDCETKPPTPKKGRTAIESIACHFHKPINEAASELGICPTVLKKICRKHNMARWPHRKLKSIEKTIQKLYASLDIAPQEIDGLVDLIDKDPHASIIAKRIEQLEKERSEICFQTC